MRRFFWLLLILAIALLVGFWIHEVQGFVLFQLQNFSIAVPLALAILGLVFGLLMLAIVWRLLVLVFSAPRHIRHYLQRNRQKQQQKNLQDGLLGWLLEDWISMEKAFKKLGALEWMPKLSWLLVAKAAHLQKQSTLQKDYLTKALNSPDAPDRRVVELIQVDFLISAQKWSEARLLLDTLKDQHLKPEWLAKRRLSLHLATGEWQAALAPLAVLHKARWVTLEQLHHYYLQIYQGILNNAHSMDVLEAAWRDVPDSLQKETAFLACYAKALLHLQQGDVAEMVLRKSLKTTWNETLFLLYCQSMGKDAVKQIELAEHWFKAVAPTDITLLAMGHLCTHQQMIGRAKHYYQSSIQIKPSYDAYRALAEIYTQEKQLPEAIKAYQCAMTFGKCM